MVEKTFHPTEKCPMGTYREKKHCQSYMLDGDLYCFMDVETYDQIALSKD